MSDQVQDAVAAPVTNAETPVVPAKRTRKKKEKAVRAPRQVKAKLIILEVVDCEGVDALVSLKGLASDTGPAEELTYASVKAARNFVKTSTELGDGVYRYARILGQNVRKTSQITKVSLS